MGDRSFDRSSYACSFRSPKSKHHDFPCIEDGPQPHGQCMRGNLVHAVEEFRL